jgi:hypothetical protein
MEESVSCVLKKIPSMDHFERRVREDRERELKRLHSTYDKYVPSTVEKGKVRMPLNH